MPQKNPWESEYQNPKFLSLGTEPLADVRDAMRWLRRTEKVDLIDFTVLDLGCGNGKNLVYIIKNYATRGIGYDISPTAISEAKKLSEGLEIAYEVRSIGEEYPIADNSIDLVLDITSSGSLNESERKVFLSEVNRVLRSGGYMIVRALAKDGDANAKKLLAEYPGPEPDTYILPEVDITERVFSREDFENMYAENFEIKHLEKTNGYQRWANKNYKRNYWVAYLQKN